ncbi:putative ribonuclease H-like domain-containing protein [Tanacetum coccineum]
MVVTKEHLRRFHGMDDAKEIWEAIRTRFGGNANSKKMQKLEAHGAEVSTEDANHKFLKSLPSAWSNLAMTMRTKPDVDTLSINNLYNNLRVFEQELASTSKSSASAQNIAFVSHSKSNTNKVKFGHTGAYSTYTPSTSSNNIPEREVRAGFADEVIYLLFVKQSEDLDLLHEDLEQIDDLDIEEMDINWQLAMIAIRMKKFYKKTRRRVWIDGNKPVGFDKKKLECFKCHNTGHFARECTSKGTNDGKKRDSFYQDQGAGKKEQNQNCLLTMDDGVVNWGEHTVEEVETNHALMAISSNNEVSLCSKTCIDSYNKLKTLCDEQTNQLGEQEAKILAYNQAVKKLEAQIVTFQKQQLSLNEQLTFQANELYEKDEKLKKYRRIGMKAVKEKEQLQKIVDSWKDSSKNLWKLVNSSMSSNSKVGLGYGIRSNNEVLSYEEEMNRTMFNCTEEDFVAKPLYNRFSKTDNLKGVPHPLTGDYTPKPQQEIDESLYLYDTLSVLGKFDGKCDEGFLVGYSLNSKAFRVYNLVTKKVEVNLHVKFLEEKPNVKGVGYRWMLDIDYLTDSMNYIPVSLDNQSNQHAGTSEVTNSAGTLQTPNANASEEEDKAEELIVVPTALQNLKTQENEAYSIGISEDTPKILAFRRELEELAPKHLREVPRNKSTSTTSVNSGSSPVNTQHADQDDSDMPELTIFNKPQKGIFDEASYDDKGMVHDFNNLLTEGVVEAIQEELLQFRLQQVWILVYLPHGAKVIGTKWVYRNKRDERGVVVRNKARLVDQDEEVYVSQPPGFVDPDHPKKVYKVVKALYGLHQAPRAWYATLSTFLEEHGYRRGTIDKTLFIKKDKKDIMLVQVYVDDIIFGSTRKSWCDEFEALMKGRFQMSSMGELIFFLGLQVKQKTDGIFISQDKYVADMLKKFDLASVKTAITPMETKMALTKDEEADEVDVHLYRSMIGSLMYLTASRPDIMFAVCACSRFQVTPKTSHLNAVKRIFKYLKGKPNLGLWYPRESSFDLEAYSDSDYAGANLDRKSTTGGCQFLGSRLISWQCKKQTIVATSTTEAEYVAAASCCGQVLWIQNQMLDYGFNFMNTKIHIDNESTICIVKNPVYHSKTKHIEIRHHFIRDSYEKKLIRVEKIHTDFNVADLLTKAFDGPRFNFLVVNIGMINP